MRKTAIHRAALRIDPSPARPRARRFSPGNKKAKPKYPKAEAAVSSDHAKADVPIKKAVVVQSEKAQDVNAASGGDAPPQSRKNAKAERDRFRDGQKKLRRKGANRRRKPRPFLRQLPKEQKTAAARKSNCFAGSDERICDHQCAGERVLGDESRDKFS